MTALIIVLRNQEQNLGTIYSAIRAQTLVPDVVVFAVDRSQQDYEAAVRLISETHGMNVDVVLFEHNKAPSDLFLAGKTRDAAIDFIWNKYGRMPCIFIDGDCVPSPRLVEHHSTWLMSKPYPVATCGYRESTTQDGGLEPDKRTRMLQYSGRIFGRFDRLQLGSIAKSKFLTWSCNLGLNELAIEELRHINNTMYGEERTFCSFFDGAWGSEDSVIGPTLHHIGGAQISLSANRSKVTHQWHPQRGQADGWDPRMSEYLEKMYTSVPTYTSLELAPTTHAKGSRRWYEAIRKVSSIPQWFSSLAVGYSSSAVAYAASQLLDCEIVAVNGDHISITDEVLAEVRRLIDQIDISYSLENNESLLGEDMSIELQTIVPTLTVIKENPKEVCGLVLIVPLHNQEKTVTAVVNGLRSQTVFPKQIIFVLDRCSDTTEQKLRLALAESGLQTTIIIRSIDEAGFRAGQVRNLGEKEAGDYEGLIFLDGDCIPCPTLVEAYADLLEDKDYPIAAFGLRYDETGPDSGEFQPDTRVYRSPTPVFKQGKNHVILDGSRIYSHMATWSCNLGLSRLACAKLRSLNDGEIFSNKLTQGVWGGEDTYLGIQLWENWATVVAVDPNICSVRHIWHPTNSSAGSALDKVSELTHRTQKTTIYRNPIPGLAADAHKWTHRLWLTATHADNVPGLYNYYWPKVAEKTERRAIAQRALASLLTRSIHVENNEYPDAKNYVVTDASYLDERAHVEHLVLCDSISPDEAGNYLAQNTSVTFDAYNNNDVMFCPACGSLVSSTWSDIHNCHVCNDCESQSRHRLLQMVLNNYNMSEMSVLVLGPNHKSEANIKYRCKNYTGLDISESRYGVNLVADVMDIPMPDASIDIVCSLHVLEHLDDDLGALKELRRILKPDGMMLIGVPECQDEITRTLPSTASAEERHRYLGWPDHIRLYGKDLPQRFGKVVSVGGMWDRNRVQENHPLDLKISDTDRIWVLQK